MGWGNIYKRRMRIFALALVIYVDYKAVQQRDKWTRKSKKAALWQKAHERNGRRVLKVIIELEGLWVKLGQYLSTRADVLPQPYISLLKQLQDSLPPRPLEEVCQTIERELGKSVEELFLKYDEVPLATASIAQVHRATLRDGQNVVVKVQHDGIKDIILEDLKNAKSIVDWVAWAEPQYDFNPMIDEWCKEAPNELDFNHEAENMRKVSRNLGCHGEKNGDVPANHVDVLIPEVIQSTEKVLVLEYMDGIRLNDIESLHSFGVDKQKLVEEITRAYAHQIYVDGFFNGDPHPGNFLVSKDFPHRPVLLDFGLTKSLSHSMKQALAKMFLASVEGDQVALLSAFAEMGLKLRLDMPEQAMEIANVFFRASTPASEAIENVKSLAEKRARNMKLLQEKMNLNEKEVKHFNPVDAFPGDIVIFTRVINLLRGLSSTMNARIAYVDIMRPFAESVLQGNLNRGPSLNNRWIFDSPVHSDAELKLRNLLIALGNANKILGIQVCAYKDGEVIIDTAAGDLGKYDPRPVQPDSLFPVFSVTKGITAGLLHWLVDNGKLRLEENISNIWPEFGSNAKDRIKVHHVLNHTSGLHNALGTLMRENPLLATDWDECLKCMAMATPESEPGSQQIYHYLSFGWICGGIIEHASGKRFQEVLEEALIHPLNVEGELYVGIPPGVESRLATLTVDMDDLSKLSTVGNREDLPSTFQPQDMLRQVGSLPAIFNALQTRRSIMPSANGHCSARALARFYAALVDGGFIPPPHCSSEPLLGSHLHIPKFPSAKIVKKSRAASIRDALTGAKRVSKSRPAEEHQTRSEGLPGRSAEGNRYTKLPTDRSDDNASVPDIATSDGHQIKKLFNNPKIHDAFTGTGEYENLAVPDGQFGLGFRRTYSMDGRLVGFGHSGIGGSIGYCNIEHRFAIAVTLNKLSMGVVTAKIIDLVCTELDIPLPKELHRFVEGSPGNQADSGMPIIN
ncbi:OLC1v1030672C1 [Oldenlandia corymbosa var. corymbosa]|uniref:OLC1v1030672C1 n=1 Tax=Oldenlandia corymbosa var. corymbosa TaxID=529605 RepID=A0AAV1CGQ4_OLDCO|nr:OLC1v1030672C1 [Oldenlandia corymbosa var. corymbosa]